VVRTCGERGIEFMNELLLTYRSYRPEAERSGKR